jgi:hypothetical protein
MPWRDPRKVGDPLLIPCFFSRGPVNVQDAINFFAQYGSHTPIKFVHLVRALGDEAVVYRPYDLIIVNPRDTGHDYYTMSAAGTQIGTLLMMWALNRPHRGPSSGGGRGTRGPSASPC